MNDTTSTRVGPAASSALPGWARALVVTVVVLVLGWYAYGTARANAVLVTARPVAYYELLTEAILAGRTHLSLEPDPRLAQLENPWGGAQGIPRAHDATYYRGKYYLYFGVAPVILLLAPWRLATGTYLTDGAAIGVFIAAGYLLAVWFFLRCRRRFFAELAPSWTVLAVLMLGLGSFLHYNLWGAQFYQVPIACAFVCGLVAAHGMLTAALAGSVRGAAGGLALASLACGWAVGARPNFIVSLLPLGVAAAVLWWRARRAGAGGAGWLLVAAVGPAGLVGAGLAAYNYARFGSIFEFGLTYQFAAIDMRAYKLLGPENIGPALRAYLLAGPAYSFYFPFIRTSGDTFGLLVWGPFVGWALAVPALAFCPRWRGPAWGIGVGFVLGAGLAVLGSLLIYSYLLERYQLDFTAWLMPAALLGASGALAWVRGRGVILRAAVRVAVGLTLAWTLVHSFVHSWPAPGGWSDVRAVARVVNRLPAWLEKQVGWPHGPAEFEIVLPAEGPSLPEPIIASGQGRDAIYLERLGPESYRFGFAHQTLPGLAGDPFVARPGQRLRLRVDLGGFYPPRDHPAFAGWGDAETALLRRRVLVECDGRTVLRAESPFYDSDPLDLRLGEARYNDWLAPRFNGEIGPIRRTGLPTLAEVSEGLVAGAVRLRVKFPPFKAMVGEPLVSTGRTGAGDLIYAFYLGPGRLRFAHDSWSSGQLETGPVRFDPAEEQVIDLDFGALHPAKAAGLGPFRLHFNGREIVAQDRPYHPAKPTEAAFGLNAIAASTADVRFSGERLVAERLARLEAPPADWGPLALTLREPAEWPVGRAEPLLVTGRTGAGEFVYLRYLPGRMVQVGYDLWGVGGGESAPLAWPSGEDLLVQISVPALSPGEAPGAATLPEASRAKLAGTVRIRVNGRVVHEQPVRPYPASPAEVWVGENPIGGSTCGERFTGKLVRRQRVDPGAGW